MNTRGDWCRVSILFYIVLLVALKRMWWWWSDRKCVIISAERGLTKRAGRLLKASLVECP